MTEKTHADTEIRAALARLVEEYLDSVTYFVVIANH